MALIAALRQFYELAVLMADIAGKRRVNPVQAEPGCSLVIEGVLRPGARRVADSAVLCKTGCNMIRAFGAGIVLFVTGYTIRSLVAEIPSGVACRAFLRSMRSR